MTRNRFQPTRRGLIAGLASTGGLMLSGCRDDPPTYGNVLRMGDDLTYRVHRMLLSPSALAREFDHAQITSMPAIGTVDPLRSKGEFYDADGARAFAAIRHDDYVDWRLRVEGSVDRPQDFALADLKRMARRIQVTRHMCEEGWSAIAEWTGVPLRAVLEAAGIRASARFVQFYAYDAIADGIDMVDALHPQTILAYGMNGRPLPLGHGAPLRLRVERQIGYKSVKFLRRIVVTDRFDDLGGAGPLKAGWAWYTGI
jgi:DMSO/TMAO reductase YedYZ molybdopterin-dependent catalytic subunit